MELGVPIGVIDVGGAMPVMVVSERPQYEELKVTWL